MKKWKVVTIQPQTTIDENGVIKTCCADVVIEAEHAECLGNPNLLCFYNIKRETADGGFVNIKKDIIAMFSVHNLICVKEVTDEQSS